MKKMKKKMKMRMMMMMVGLALIAALAPLIAAVPTTTTTTIQTAYAQQIDDDEEEEEQQPALTMNKEITNPSSGGEASVINAQSAENSENAAATRESTSSLSVEPQGEPDDTPAHRGELSLKLPNDTTKERVVESAPQSSGAPADGVGSTFLVTTDIL